MASSFCWGTGAARDPATGLVNKVQEGEPYRARDSSALSGSLGWNFPNLPSWM